MQFSTVIFETVIFEMEEDDLYSEWLVEELESSTVSQESISSESSVSTGKSSFKKHPWFSRYFCFDGQLTHCKACESQFKNRSYPRLFHHLNKCSKITENSVTTMDGLVDDLNVNTTRNELWTAVIVENNIPIRCVESPTFKRFASNVNKSWKLPSRREISAFYIPRLSRKLREEFSSKITRGKVSNLSIEFDHWTDANNRSFLGVIATDPAGNKYLVDLRDVSLKGHSADIIVEELIQALKHIPTNMINSIISDSASNCKKARQDILAKKGYGHLIQHRCLAHLFNRIGCRITSKNQEITETISLASKITSYISSSSYWSAYIKQLNMKRVRPACPVRWYSTVTMLDNLCDLKTVILEEIVPSLSDDKAQVVRALDWEHLESILHVLKPLNECIGRLEQKDISLGEAFMNLLNYAKDLFADSESPSEALIAARVSFLWHLDPKRISREEFGLLIASYALNRSHEWRYITEDGADLALEAITRIAIRSGATLARVKSSLVDEFETYRNFGDDYVMPDVESDPAKWWSERLGNGLIAKLAIRLAYLKASSTNIERTFSTLKGIQGGGRLNLSISSLVDICRVKISSGVISDEDCHNIDMNDSLDQSMSSQDLDSSAEGSSTSEITVPEHEGLSDWLKDQSPEIVQSHKRFFQYIDFGNSGVVRSRSVSRSGQISEDEIRNLVSSVRASRQLKDCGVIVDCASQVIAYDILSTCGDAHQS